MPDPPLGLVAHPLAVVAHVLRQPLPRPSTWLPVLARAPPGSPAACPANFGGISIIALLISTATGFRSLAYALQPQPLRLQRDRAAAGERIVEGGSWRSRLRRGFGSARSASASSVARAPAPPRWSSSPTCTSSSMSSATAAALPPAPSSVGNSSGSPTDRRPTAKRSPPGRRQRPPRPPQMQRGRMPVPDRSSPAPTGHVDRVQRHRHFDQLLRHRPFLLNRRPDHVEGPLSRHSAQVT